MLGTPVAPSAATNTVLYTGPAAGVVGVCSQIIATNQGSADSKIRVGISSGSDTTVLTPEWIVYDAVVAPNDFLPIPVADYIANGYSIVVYTLLATVSFRACGFEQRP